MSELTAPFFPVPTPVGGRISTTFDAQANIARLADPNGWSAHGRVESNRARYRDAVLDEIDSDFTLGQGRLNLPDVAAKLGGNPLSAKLALDLAGAGVHG